MQPYCNQAIYATAFICHKAGICKNRGKNADVQPRHVTILNCCNCLQPQERFLQMQQQVLEVHMHMADVLRALTTTSDKLTAAMQALQQGTYDGNLSRLDNGHICRSQQ